jgi:hypothetical protein
MGKAKRQGPYRAWLVRVEADDSCDPHESLSPLPSSVAVLVYARSRSEARGDVARDLAEIWCIPFGEAVQHVTRAVRAPWADRQDQDERPI